MSTFARNAVHFASGSASCYADAAIQNLLELAAAPGLYHPQYGFRDSIDTATGDVTDRILTLDQEWLFLAIANHLEDTVWRYLYADERIRQAHEIMYPGTPATSPPRRVTGRVGR